MVWTPTQWVILAKPFPLWASLPSQRKASGQTHVWIWQAPSLAPFKPLPWARPGTDWRTTATRPDAPALTLLLFLLDGSLHFLTRYTICFLILFAVYRSVSP